MKITKISTIPLGYTKDAPPIPRSLVLVRVETDAGHVGFGEASTSYGHFYPSAVATLVDDILARVLIGRNPLDIQGCMHDMHRYLDPWLGWEGITTQTIGAIEIALWDILGKELGRPICQLFGSWREKIPLYGTGSTYLEKGPDWHARFFDASLERGFKGVKTRIANGVRKDIAQVTAVREYVGPDVKVMVDAYWAYSVDSAIRLAKEMDGLDIYFFEEPVPQYMLDGLARLRAESPVPIALGERIYSLHGFQQVVQRQAVDVLQPDPTVCPGIMECIEVATLGKANNLIVIPHIGGLTAVGIAANLHLAAIIQSPMLEYDVAPYQPLRDDILVDPIFSLERLDDGCLRVPDGPGLGIEIDESAFEKFAHKPGKIYPDIYPQLGVGQL
jgi:L-alanine-DL-glutamate epimerase-like enolase superfamily enzyme